MSKKALILLWAILPLFANAQSTHQLDSMLAEIITKAPEKDQERHEYIRTHYFDTLSFSETDSIGQKNLCARFYYSFADSSSNFSESYYRSESIAPYINYQAKSDTFGLSGTIYYHMIQEELITTFQQSKAVEYITYSKTIYLTSPDSKLHIIKHKRRVKKKRARQLQKQYVVSIYRVNAVTKTTVEVPPKNPKFNVKVYCGMYYNK